MPRKKRLAYVVGIALGDGNLSNPNGRAVRLRITCDARYPRLTRVIIGALRVLLPQNSVSKVYVPDHKNFVIISVYSNQLKSWMPWKVGRGTKEVQRARVPLWIRRNPAFCKECLRGLLQTDGSIYKDRGYLMINFTNNTRALAEDVYNMLRVLGHRPTLSKTPARDKVKYTVRIARNPEKLIRQIGLFKE